MKPQSQDINNPNKNYEKKLHSIIKCALFEFIYF